MIRACDWKLIEWYEDGAIELYNIRQDIGENRNLAAQHPDKVTMLHEELIAWRKEVGAIMPAPNPAYDPKAELSRSTAETGEERAALESIAAIDAPFGMPRLQRPIFPKHTVDIRDYGAVGDGQTLNTQAISKAIAGCAKAGGGRVQVPAGIWLTGAIHLKSNIDLHLTTDAVLRFSTNPNDYLPVVFTRWAGFECYNYSPLIYARGCENIAITGPGRIDGQGKSWWPWAKHQHQTALMIYEEQVLKGVAPEQRIYGTREAGLRPQLISPIGCRNVLLEGFTIVHAGPFWTVDVIYCENVIMRRLSLRTTGGPNTDGLDVDSCRNVLIEHCTFDTGDDCICMKSGINEDGSRASAGRPRTWSSAMSAPTAATAASSSAQIPPEGSATCTSTTVPSTARMWVSG